MDTIALGKHNPRLSDLRKANQRSTLTSDGLLPVESPTLVHEAHRSGLEINTLLVREGTAIEGLPKASAVYVLDAPTFKSIQDTEHSQGVIALVRPAQWTLEDVLKDSQKPVVVLAGLQDPGNVGTILRVAESFGAGGCLGLKGTVAVHNSKVVRASAGSVFRLPCVWNLEPAPVTAAINAAGRVLTGTSPSAGSTILSVDWTKPVAFMIGNEGSGLRAEHLEMCAEVRRIPHEPQTESLNSAIAAAIVLYEAYRGRLRG